MNKSGFTLIETMIVVVIIGLLAAIAIPNLLRSKITANDTNARAALKTLSTAVELYSTVNGVYPTDITSLTSTTPPYLNVNLCGVTDHGFTIDCVYTSSGYSFSAVPISTGAVGTGSTTFTMITGGVMTP